MPDGIATYRWRGQDLVVTANEGDAREWGDYTDARRLSHRTFVLCEEEFPNATELKAPENMGRFNLLTDLGYDEERGCYSELYSLGSRSFLIYTASLSTMSTTATGTRAMTPTAPATGRLPVTSAPRA